LKCPHCNTESTALVLETRKQDDSIVRKRGCGACHKYFYSQEAPVLGLTLKRDRIDKRTVRGEIVAKPPRATNLDAFSVWR